MRKRTHKTLVPRIKTAVTIDKDLLAWIDSQVKEGIFSSRSHAIHYALLELKKRKTQK